QRLHEPRTIVVRVNNGGSVEPLPPIFMREYHPTNHVDLPYPEVEVDFNPSGAYSLYNWELFFHIPLLIAFRLSKNQRFEEAQRWFHYIFDPTDSSVDEDSPQRFWKVLPFKHTERRRIEELL